MWKADKTVSVTTQFGVGRYDDAKFADEPDVLGIITVPLQVYDKDTEKWEDHPTNTRLLFGRCTTDGYMTHMCYGSDYVDWNSFLGHAETHCYFYFDAGGNGRPVRITYEELKRAMTELGIVK